MILISKHPMQAHSLAEALENPRQITSLVLSGQELTRIPAKVWKKLPQLESLDLSHNKIKKLPAGLARLTQLRRLQLSFNQVTRIEENLLGLLPQLKHLDLRKNRLRQLSLGSTSLETLDLSENRLQGVAPVQLFCPELLHLNLSFNKIAMLPFEENDLPRLQYLNLAHNRLPELPILPVHLYALIINHNRLEKLNLRGKSLPDLQRLEVAHNPLELPVQRLRHFPKLSYLDVRYTPTSWPGLSALLHRLPQLRHLYGGLGRKLQDQVAGFLAEIPVAVPAAQKDVFFKLWQGFAAGPVPAELLWSCLNERWHPTIQIGAYYELIRKHPARTGQLRSRLWYIYGQPASSQLTDRLRTEGVQTTEDIREATGVLLGTNFNSQSPAPVQKVVIIDERSVTHWLDRQQRRFLTHSRERPQIANLRRLLTAKDEASLQLGMQMLRAQGTPDDLIDELLKKWLRQEKYARRQWEEVLLPYLPGDLQIAMSNRKRMLVFPSRRGKAGVWWKTLRKQ